jgi:hypothetical protein
MTRRRSCRSLAIPHPLYDAGIRRPSLQQRRVASWSRGFVLLPASRLPLFLWGETASHALAMRMILIRTRNPTIPMRNRIPPNSLLRPMTAPRLRRRMTVRLRPTIAAATTPTPHLSKTNRSETLPHLTMVPRPLWGRNSNRQIPWPRIDLPGGATYKPALEIWRETHLSTIPACPQAPPRLPRAHGDQGRSQGAGTAQGQGAQAPVGLIGR